MTEKLLTAILGLAWNLYLLVCVVHTTVDIFTWAKDKWRNRGGRSNPPQ